jgi:hypothetical protein
VRALALILAELVRDLVRAQLLLERGALASAAKRGAPTPSASSLLSSS